MKDYARNNFKQFAEDNNFKNKPKKQRPKNSKKLLIYVVAIILGIIIILSLISLFGSNEQTVNSNDFSNQTKIIAPKTPEIFNTPASNAKPIKADNTTVNEPIETASITSEAIINENQDIEINSTNMQQIANENLDQEDVLITDNETIETDNSPKFTFYNDLSNQEIESDAVEKKAKKYVYTYMLQVGSYKDKEAVDAMRARLLLIGLKPDVSKHGSWYRIDVGPVHSKREGDVLKHKLEAAKISGSMLRQISKKEVIEEPQQPNQEKKAN